jgi:RNase P/RNase MRP subunit p30
MINTQDIDEARKQIQKLKKEKKQIIVLAQTPEFNRKIIENKDVDILLDPHLHNRKDKLKQKDSGLNEILCKIAKKNNIKIGIKLSEIKKAKGKDKSILLARIKQNIALCKRTKTDIILIGKYDKKDAFSFLLTLGASTNQAKKATEA